MNHQLMRRNLNMLRYFHLDYTGSETDNNGVRSKQPIHRHEEPCSTCDDLIEAEGSLDELAVDEEG